jgi:predicted NAD/FAD-binding protein
MLKAPSVSRGNQKQRRSATGGSRQSQTGATWLSGFTREGAKSAHAATKRTDRPSFLRESAGIALSAVIIRTIHG